LKLPGAWKTVSMRTYCSYSEVFHPLKSVASKAVLPDLHVLGVMSLRVGRDRTTMRSLLYHYEQVTKFKTLIRAVFDGKALPSLLS
jgi:hypothetical protein